MPYDFPVNGDVIFTSDDRLVLATQTLLRGRRAKWSHVMITISQAGALHSIPKKGVAIEGWDTLFATRRFGDERMKAYRSPNVDYFGLPVFQEAQTTYGARYNSVFIFRNLPVLRRLFLRSFFCSELAAEFLSKHGVGGDKASMRIFPVDLEQILERQGWTDVSHVYESVLSGKTAVPKIDRDMLQRMRDVIEFLQMSERQRTQAADLERRVREFTDLQMAKLNRSVTELQENTKKYSGDRNQGLLAEGKKKPRGRGASALWATLAAFWRRTRR
jgi:hypothetical protein